MKILFEDQHLVVLSKPAGLFSQGGDGIEDHLVVRLQKHFGRNFVGLVHRLDRNTSGLMVVAKRSKSADRLTKSLQSQQLKRRYLAVLTGVLSQSVVVENWLVKNEVSNEVRAYPPGDASPHANAKWAQTHFQPIFHFQWRQVNLTFCECILETGRSHQIRVQAKALGHSLLGDVKYGSRGPDFARPALHSYALEFPHPMSAERLKFFDSPPDDMLSLVPVNQRSTLKNFIADQQNG